MKHMRDPCMGREGTQLPCAASPSLCRLQIVHPLFFFCRVSVEAAPRLAASPAACVIPGRAERVSSKSSMVGKAGPLTQQQEWQGCSERKRGCFRDLGLCKEGVGCGAQGGGGWRRGREWCGKGSEGAAGEGKANSAVFQELCGQGRCRWVRPGAQGSC